MSVVLEKVNVTQKPAKREVMIFFMTLIGFLFVFLKSCWFPSTAALEEVRQETITLLEQQNQIQITQETKTRKKSINSNIKNASLYDNWAKNFAKTPDTLLMKEFANPTIIKDLKINNLEFGELKKEGEIIIQDFKLSVEGSFISFNSYLKKLENLPILIITRNINLTVVDDKFGRISAQIQGDVYGWQN